MVNRYKRGDWVVDTRSKDVYEIRDYLVGGQMDKDWYALDKKVDGRTRTEYKSHFSTSTDSKELAIWFRPAPLARLLYTNKEKKE